MALRIRAWLRTESTVLAYMTHAVSAARSFLGLVLYTCNPRPGKVEVGTLFIDQTG